jgi:adenosylhomocysteine nucleosidase
LKILVTFALGWEFFPWHRFRSIHWVSTAPNLFETEVAGNQVHVLLTGVGAQSAEGAIRKLRGDRPNVCIASGLAGGLKPEYRAGDVLVGHKVRSALGNQIVRSDERLLELAADCGAKVVDQFLGVERIVRTAQEKSHLSAFADAVEMESFTIMTEMERSGVPVVAIRSIADPVENDVPMDFHFALNEKGRLCLARVVAEALRSPKTFSSLARFGVRSFKAATSLARYLDNYVRLLVADKNFLPTVFSSTRSLQNHTF